MGAFGVSLCSRPCILIPIPYQHPDLQAPCNDLIVGGVFGPKTHHRPQSLRKVHTPDEQWPQDQKQGRVYSVSCTKRWKNTKLLLHIVQLIITDCSNCLLVFISSIVAYFKQVTGRMSGKIPPTKDAFIAIENQSPWLDR